MKHILLIISLLSANVFAEESVSEWKQENYYVKLGVGLAELSYGGEDKAVVKALKEEPGISNDTVALDIAFYKSLNSTDAIGISFGGINDNFSAKGEELDVTQNQLGGSYVHSFNHLGSGFFSRYDLGLSRYSISYDSIDVKAKAKSKIGLGALAAFGYSLDVTKETALELQAALSYRKAQDVSTLGFALTAGVFF
jgi:hypothetical protein